MALEVGTKAPDFTLPGTPDLEVRLTDYLGKKHVVLEFYVFDFTGNLTSGCMGTLVNYQRDLEKFEALNAQILACSCDSIFAHRVFSSQLGGLSFPLLSDYNPKGATAMAFDVWSPDRSHCRNVTFVIDTQGAIRLAKLHGKGGIPDNQETLLVLRALQS